MIKHNLQTVDSEIIDKTNILAEDIENISGFVENKENNVYGFTITLKGGEIRNFFISCDFPQDFEKLEELKQFYHELKNPKEKN